MELISIVIPAYNEEQNIPRTIEALKETLHKRDLSYELIFVDDGSKDGTWEVLKEYIDLEEGISALRFSRNFGKEAAIFAGLKAAKGDYVAVMDCDLQHPPEVLLHMIDRMNMNGFDIIEGRKRTRGKESKLHRAFVKLFYKILNSSSGLDLEDASDFKLMNRKAVDALNEMPERLTFFRALSKWVGFQTDIVYFDVAEREIGETKWSFSKLFRYAIHSITSFSNLPMQIVTFCGVIFFLFSVILGVETLYNLFSGRSAEGFTTVILLLLIMGSIIMLSLGIIGYYLSKIYEEIKMRPRYIISEKLEHEQEQDEKE